MEFKVGLVVKSMAGHDVGRFYVIMKMEGNFAYVVDGKFRKLESPKKKNLIHLSRIDRLFNLDKFSTNKSLREFLHSYNYPEHNNSN